MVDNGSKEENFQYDPDKNYDEQIMAQQRKIEQQIVTNQCLIGEKVTLEDISEEYAKEDIIYQNKIKKLTDKYKFVRRSRGDGNCFYRAFGFSYLEYIVQNTANVQRFYDTIAKSKDELVNLGFPSFTIEDFYDNFMSVMEEVKNGCDVNKLLEIFNDQALSDCLVVYLRLMVSGHLQKEQEFYCSFLDGDQTIQQFCHQEVEPMGKESDHIHIIALTSALDVSVRIAYMDRTEGSSIVIHNFPHDSPEPQVLLLYRPGHYDILYTK